MADMSVGRAVLMSIFMGQEVRLTEYFLVWFYTMADAVVRKRPNYE